MTTISVPAQTVIYDSPQNIPTNSTFAVIVHKSNENTTFLSQIISGDHWIVDTDVTDYLTRLQTVFATRNVLVLI